MQGFSSIIIERSDIQDCILCLRGKKVMLDMHLAALYGVEIKGLLQAVKRNNDRFLPDFMFELTSEEFDVLRSQFVISNRDGRHYLPYAFTAQGVAMLSSVLESKQAVQVNIEIMRAFVNLRHMIQPDGEKMIEREITWEEFKSIVEEPKAENVDSICYRGQACCDWQLNSTLTRFLDGSKEISCNEYYAIVRKIHRELEILENVKPPDNSPFLIGGLLGDEKHTEDCEKAFSAMLELRHLGFPSPIVDWTKDPLIGAFFAFSNYDVSSNKNVAIFSLEKKKILGMEKFKLFEPVIWHVHHEIKYKPERHKNQKAMYTLLVYNKKEEYYNHNLSPFFSLSSLMPDSNYGITKYIIKNSHERRNEILNELYDSNINYSALYGETHIHENTRLKDLAIEYLLLNKIGAN